MLNVKQKIAWLWQNAEKVLIVTFFLTFTLNIRKVFLTPYSFLNGGFNEYMTMSFSWADVLMIGIIVIYNIKLLISQIRKQVSKNSLLEDVIRNKSSVIRNYYQNNVSRETIFLMLFLIWAGLSIIWAQYKPIAAFRLILLLEIVIFSYISVKTLNTPKWRNFAYYALITAGLFQAAAGIAQFVHNSSLGLHFLGESIIGPNIDGVAKIIINGEKQIRAYGTLPHPNILAGFLLVLMFVLIGKLLALYIYLPPSDPLLKNQKFGMRSMFVSRETFVDNMPVWMHWLFLIIISLGFILTFSRSAFLGLFIGLIILFRFACSRCRTHSTKAASSYKFSATILFIIAIATIVFFKKTSFFSNQSLHERNFYQIVSYETIYSHPIKGVGIGQYILNEYVTYPDLETWRYQPVHNIFLLIFSETGIIGIVIFLLFIISVFSDKLFGRRRETSPNLTIPVLYCIIISLLVVSFFDHYFWDIRIGTIVIALPFILMAAEITIKKR